MVAVPLEQLQRLGGQDMALLSREELLAESIWSSKLVAHRPLDEGLQELMQYVINGQG